MPAAQHAEGLDDHATLVVGLADHAAFGDCRVAQQGVLDLRRAHVVTRRDDHVVGTGLVEKVAVGILHEGITRMVPAGLDIVGLARVVHVAAAGRSLHRQLADRARRHFVSVVVDDLGQIPGHHLADRATAHILRRGRHEDVEHLGGADAVEHLDATGLLPELAGGVGQGLAGTDTDAQRRRRTTLGDAGPSRWAPSGGRRWARCSRWWHRTRTSAAPSPAGCRDVREIHRRAGPHRKHQHAAQAERERQRRRAHHDVVGTARAAHGAARSRRPPAHRGGYARPPWACRWCRR
jgi:hypothetical protein